MREQAIDIPTLAEDLVNVERLYDRRNEGLALALYRLLAEGEPVSDERLAAQSGSSLGDVADWLREARVARDERGDVVAFQGLSLEPTRFVIELDGRTLYAWCAGDTFLIQDLIARPARVRSADPITGQSVSLSLADGVHDAEPATALLSMMRPEAVPSMLSPNTEIDEVAPAACGPINFFASEESGHMFTERVEGTFLLTAAQGHDLARRINRTLFGSELAEARV